MPPEDAFEIVRTRPHGHVAAVLGTVRRLGLDHLIASRPSRMRALTVAMIAARILNPRSKLATARGLDQDTLSSSLGEVLDVEGADADELYEAMDWLLGRQGRIEAALARRHLGEGALVLYHVTSVTYEGRTCPLAHWGHPRDGRRGKPQILVGVVTNGEGCPVAVEVFDGNTGDPMTLAPQISRVGQRFGLQRVVLVGDRGMLTEARLREELNPAHLDWITALRAPQIRQLVEAGGLSQSARPLRGQAQVALRVGQVLHRFKVGKHFRLEITDEAFTYERDQARIAQEAALDDIYVIRTTVPADALGDAEVVRAYKRLSTVERAFRILKSLDLLIRPIYHRLEERVRGHVLLCLLAYYVEWHMRQRLAPLLFEDDEETTADALRSSVVAPAQRSPRAQRKVQTQHTDDGLPVHSFQTLLEDLQTVAKNRVRAGGITFEVITTPTPLQQRAFDLLGVSPRL